MIVLMCGGLLLVCLGMLLGITWNIQMNQGTLRRQAEERRRLNNEWAAIRTLQRQQGECPCCESPLYEQNGRLGPKGIEERSDDGYVVWWRIS
jgi:hypothetical protein